MNRKVLIGVKFAGFALLFLLFAGGATMLLWNWLMPVIFGLPVLSIWQAVGLLALSRILVGGFGGRRGKWGQHKRQRWMHRMKARWESMTPEEQAQWKEKMGNRWPGKWQGNMDA